MNLYKFEVKMLIKSVLVWASGIASFMFLYLVFFPLVMVDNDVMTQVMANFPDEFLAFFGMNSDLAFTSIMGYYGLTMSFIYIPIAIQASLYGVSIISIEEREYTADFLLTKPVSRRKIFITKFLAALTALTTTNIILWIFSFLGLFLFNGGMEVDYAGASLLLSTIIIMQLYFLCLGLMISVLVKKVTSVIAYSMGLGFGLFILSSFGEMLSIELIKLMTPFSHFEPIGILADKSIDILSLSISIFVIIISLVLAYFLYQKRNIKAL